MFRSEKINWMVGNISWIVKHFFVWKLIGKNWICWWLITTIKTIRVTKPNFINESKLRLLSFNAFMDNKTVTIDGKTFLTVKKVCYKLTKKSVLKFFSEKVAWNVCWQNAPKWKCRKRWQIDHKLIWPNYRRYD